MHLKFSGMKWVELICMTYLWTHIHFCYPKPFHCCFCRFVPKHTLPSEPKIFFSSVTGEQEELVAKMLASGMDEATAYQYLQQLCGGAGKGSKPTLTHICYSIHTPENAVQLYPCLHPSILIHTSICRFTNTCQRTRNVQSFFVFWLLLYLAHSCFLNHSIILQLCATYVVRPCLKASLPTETLCNVGGAVSFRTAEESVENAKEILNAFDRAILKHKNRPKIEVPKRKLPPPTSRLSLVFSYFPFYFSQR